MAWQRGVGGSKWRFLALRTYWRFPLWYGTDLKTALLPYPCSQKNIIALRRTRPPPQGHYLASDPVVLQKRLHHTLWNVRVQGVPMLRPPWSLGPFWDSRSYKCLTIVKEIKSPFLPSSYPKWPLNCLKTSKIKSIQWMHGRTGFQEQNNHKTTLLSTLISF